MGQQLLVAGCAVLALAVLIGSLSLVFHVSGTPKLPKSAPTFKAGAVTGSSGVHLTLLNVSYSRLVADTALSERIKVCLQQSIASVAEVLQPSDVHVVFSRAVGEPDTEPRSDSSTSNSNIARSAA